MDYRILSVFQTVNSAPPVNLCGWTYANNRRAGCGYGRFLFQIYLKPIRPECGNCLSVRLECYSSYLHAKRQVPCRQFRPRFFFAINSRGVWLNATRLPTTLKASVCGLMRLREVAMVYSVRIWSSRFRQNRRLVIRLRVSIGDGPEAGDGRDGGSGGGRCVPSVSLLRESRLFSVLPHAQIRARLNQSGGWGFLLHQFLPLPSRRMRCRYRGRGCSWLGWVWMQPSVSP